MNATTQTGFQSKSLTGHRLAKVHVIFPPLREYQGSISNIYDPATFFAGWSNLGSVAASWGGAFPETAPLLRSTRSTEYAAQKKNASQSVSLRRIRGAV